MELVLKPVGLAAALACLIAGLASAGVLNPDDAPSQAEIINLAAYQRLTHIIVVPGSENFRAIREQLLMGIEDGLEGSNCWAVMRHGLAAEKLNGISLDAPSPTRWKNDAEVSSQLLTLIPKRRHQLGVLVFWVRDWDSVSTAGKGGPLRDAVAELYDSASGKQIWRAHLALRPGAGAESGGEPASGDTEALASRTQDEMDEFVGFFVDGLAHPPGVPQSCVPRPELALAGLGDQDPNAELIVTLKTAAEASDRAQAAKALGKEDNEAAVAPLIEALSDPELKVRAFALDALGQIGSVSAVDPVVGQLSDPDRLLRALAARALGRIGSNKAAPALNALLKAEKEPVVRKTAEKALAHINDPTNLTNLVIEIPADWGVPGL